MSAKSKTEARKELDLLRRAADDGLPLTAGSMTLADLLTVWTEQALPNRALADSAITSHKWAIKILIEEMGDAKVRQLTPDQVEAPFLRRSGTTEVGQVVDRCRGQVVADHCIRPTISGGAVVEGLLMKDAS